MISEVKQGNTVKASYRWLSDGTKALVQNAGGNGYAYLGSLVYTKSGSGYRLESAGFGGGRIQVSGSTVIPHYQVTDHLGSVRVVFTNKTANGVTARNDYYAYGKRHTNSNLALGSETTNRFLFNGKEAQITGELGLLDFGARMYSGEFVRWWSLDPLASKRLSISPFAYCQNSPVVRIDPTGMIDDWYLDEDEGHLVYLRDRRDDVIITDQGERLVNIGDNNMFDPIDPQITEMKLPYLMSQDLANEHG